MTEWQKWKRRYLDMWADLFSMLVHPEFAAIVSIGLAGFILLFGLVALVLHIFPPRHL